MTVPTPLDVKAARNAVENRPRFKEDQHPRDRKGRFIQKGARVKIGFGSLGTVVRNVGKGRIEVSRDSDKKNVIVSSRVLTVVANPDGTKPGTPGKHDKPAAQTIEKPSAGALHVSDAEAEKKPGAAAEKPKYRASDYADAASHLGDNATNRHAPTGLSNAPQEALDALMADAIAHGFKPGTPAATLPAPGHPNRPATPSAPAAPAAAKPEYTARDYADAASHLGDNAVNQYAPTGLSNAPQSALDQLMAEAIRNGFKPGAPSGTLPAPGHPNRPGGSAPAGPRTPEQRREDKLNAWRAEFDTDVPDFQPQAAFLEGMTPAQREKRAKYLHEVASVRSTGISRDGNLIVTSPKEGQWVVMSATTMRSGPDAWTFSTRQDALDFADHIEARTTPAGNKIDWSGNDWNNAFGARDGDFPEGPFAWATQMRAEFDTAKGRAGTPSQDEIRAKKKEEILKANLATAGLDDRWTLAGASDFKTSLSKLKPGDIIVTKGDGSIYSPVELPVMRGSALPGYANIPRRVDRVERREDGKYAVHFTDGTNIGTGTGTDGENTYIGRRPVYTNNRAIEAGKDLPQPGQGPAPMPGSDLLDADGNPTEAAVDRFLGGDCWQLAKAMHDETGWPMVAVAYEGDTGSLGWSHVLVRRPDGKLVDVDGVHDEGPVLDRWAYIVEEDGPDIEADLIDVPADRFAFLLNEDPNTIPADVRPVAQAVIKNAGPGDAPAPTPDPTPEVRLPAELSDTELDAELAQLERDRRKVQGIGANERPEVQAMDARMRALSREQAVRASMRAREEGVDVNDTNAANVQKGDYAYGRNPYDGETGVYKVQGTRTMNNGNTAVVFQRGTTSWFQEFGKDEKVQVIGRGQADETDAGSTDVAGGTTKDTDTTPDPVDTTPSTRAEIAAYGAGTGTSRPVLYTYQRKNLVALGLDDDPAQPESVRQAAARVRARKPLSADHSAVLAAAVRKQAAADGVRPVQQRSLNRLADRLDAASAVAENRPVPTREKGEVITAKPTDLALEDTVALPNFDGSVTVGKVTAVRSMMKGRLVEVTVTDAEGNESTRLMQAGTDAYVLPDLPDETPVNELPEGMREAVGLNDLNVGDVIDLGGPNSIMRITGSSEERFTGDTVYQLANVNGDPLDTTEISPSRSYGRTFIRTERGEASKAQPLPGLLIPSTGDRTVKSSERTGLKAGQYVEAVDGYTNHKGWLIEDAKPYNNGKNVKFEIRTVEGRRVTMITRPRGTTVTAYGEPDAGVNAHLADEAKREAREREVGALTNSLSQNRRAIANMVLNPLLSDGAGSLNDRFGRTTDQSGAAEWAAKQVETESSKGDDDMLAAILTMQIMTGLGRDTIWASPQGRELGFNEELKAAALDFVRETRADLAESLRNSYARNGETYLDSLKRDVVKMRSNPPRLSESRDMAETIYKLREQMDAAEAGLPAPEVAPDVTITGATVQDRLPHYRKALGLGFGKEKAQVAVFKNVSLADLKAGKVPDFEMKSVTRDVPTAADGGPSALHMKHLSVVRAAGKDIDTLVQAHIATQLRAKGVDLPAGVTPEEHEANLRKAQKAASTAYYNAGASYADAKYAEFRATAAELQTFTNALDMRQARRDATIAVMKDLGIEMGGVKANYIHGAEKGPSTGATLTEDNPLVKSMRYAEESYPKAWLNLFKSKFPKVTLFETDRGFNSGGDTIALSTGPDFTPEKHGRVAVHELGHSMEIAIPGLSGAQSALMWSRTSTGELGSRVREKQIVMYTTKKYGDELSYKDNFPQAYTGKEYGNSGHFEVFTTSMESLMSGSEYMDEDLRHWTLGTLALLGNAGAIDAKKA